MRRYFILLVLMGLMMPVCMTGQEKQNNFEISKSLDIYNSLLRELNLNYVDEINPGELNETAIDAMLKGLDPYTVFIPESEIESYKLMTTGEYGGIGALIQYDGEYTRISDPYEGWPAQKAGLQAGDAILSVNGVDTHKKATEEVSELLKGQPGTEVTLKIKRYGEEKPIEKEDGTHIGIFNSAYRLKRLCGEDCRLDVRSVLTEGTTVRIMLPLAAEDSTMTK